MTVVNPISGGWTIKVLLLFIFLSPHFMLLKTVLLMAFCLLNIKAIVSRIDATFLAISVFVVLYQLIASLNGTDEVAVNALGAVFLPPMIYILGKLLALREPDFSKLGKTIIYIGLVIAAIPMWSVLLDLNENGFSATSRNLALIWDPETITSATVIAGYFTVSMCFVSLFWAQSGANLRWIKLISIAFAVLAFVLCLRLGSRTQLVIIFSAMACGLLINFRDFEKKNVLIWAVLAAAAVAIFLFLYDSEVDLFLHFADRVDNDEAGAGTAGGRTERWGMALVLLSQRLFGWRLEEFGYAHNIFLDAARVSGLFAAVALLAAYWCAAATANKFRKLKVESKFLKTLCLSIFVGVSLLFLVEPVLSGFYQIFLFFLFLSGLMSGVNLMRVAK